jgi:pseudouridine synthase
VKERLQKILSGAGIASRRAAEKLILEGRVRVDGEIVTELGTSADPAVQDIRVDGARVKARASRPRRTVALHKPRGYVTTRSDPGRRPTVMDLLPHSMRALYPVGRLDMASTGLLILTDDGELSQRLTHPRFGVEKSYVVTVLGAPEAKVLDRAIKGIVVDGERLSVETIERIPSRRSDRTRLRCVLRRGKNREIRRLFRTLGFPVVELHRERIGALTLRGLPPGGFRPLTPKEVALLERK